MSKNIDTAARIAAIREQAVAKEVSAAIAKLGISDLKKLFNKDLYKDGAVQKELDQIEFEIKDLQHKYQLILVKHISACANELLKTDEKRVEFIASIEPKPKAKRGRKSATDAEQPTEEN